MVKISGVIITFNEEKNIERCILSMQKVVDEIVVLDSFSTDKTKEICRKYNVVFFENKFEGFTTQKNIASEKAAYNYILSLDADEALDTVLQKEILKVKDNWTHDGYFFNRLNNYCGKWIKHSNWYPDAKIRLYDRRKASWQGENNLHEVVKMSNNATQTKIKGEILHLAYNSQEEHFLKINTYTNIAAKNYVLHKNKKIGFSKIYINPFWKFFKSYFINKGFLDGYEGFIICKFAAISTFLKYIKIKELQDKSK